MYFDPQILTCFNRFYLENDDVRLKMSLNKKRLKKFEAYKFMNRKVKFNLIAKI